MNDILNLNSTSYKLESFKTLKLNGADCSSFLHSQTTNNILTLKEGEFFFDSLLNLSGKVETFFIVLKESLTEIYILFPSKIFSESIERLKKFHITEDVSFDEVDESYYLNIFCDSSAGFKGKFGFLDANISRKQLSQNLKGYEQYKDLATLSSVPILSKTLDIGEIINNTLLANIALDFNKGCFLGQETVSKIHTRRGAAVAAIMLISDEEIKADLPVKIKSMGKKIGEIRYSLSFKNKSYSLAFLNRENRIDSKELFAQIGDVDIKFLTKNFPIIDIETLVYEYYQKAVIDFQSSNEDEAIEKLKKIIKVSPYFYDAYESLGVIYGRQEKFEDAIRVMHELEKIDSKSVMAQTNLSMFYMKVGEIEKAETHKSNATINQFESLGAEAEVKRQKEKQAQLKADESKRREAMFEQVLKIDPDDALACYGLGELRLEQGQTQDSIKLLSKAISTDKKYSVAYLALAKAYIKSEQVEKAREVLCQGIEISSKNGDLMPANEMQSILVGL